jgi:hypothetical protein
LQITNHTRLALSQHKRWNRGGSARVRAAALPNANGEIPPSPLLRDLRSPDLPGIPSPSSSLHPCPKSPPTGQNLFRPEQGSTHPRYIRPRCQLQESVGRRIRPLGRRAQFSPSVEAGRGATNPRWQACACAPSGRRAAAVLPEIGGACVATEPKRRRVFFFFSFFYLVGL